MYLLGVFGEKLSPTYSAGCRIQHTQLVRCCSFCMPLKTCNTQIGGALVAGGGNDRDDEAQGVSEHTERGVSKRRPSATLAFVLMAQLQFLATLSLVDSTVESGDWWSDFLVGLR